ncbi:MAG: hypothetical protein JSS69_10175 [Acidobacteria bacterium]|nr:hypothetical protein [Acidobacteriota bacterium]MBS1866270.1 hypothetical protein [Acidobacteriota bacterium]
MKRLLAATLCALFAYCAHASTHNSANYAGAFHHPAAQKTVRATILDAPDTASLNSSSAGQSASAPHSVVLTWNASPDAAANPAVTYNAYRVTGACSASVTFTKINAAPIAALTFTDPNVAPGAYCYYVTAALNGIESVPSNQAAAAILVLPPGSVVLSAK